MPVGALVDKHKHKHKHKLSDCAHKLRACPEVSRRSKGRRGKFSGVSYAHPVFPVQALSIPGRPGHGVGTCLLTLPCGLLQLPRGQGREGEGGMLLQLWGCVISAALGRCSVIHGVTGGDWWRGDGVSGVTGSAGACRFASHCHIACRSHVGSVSVPSRSDVGLV